MDRGTDFLWGKLRDRKKDIKTHHKIALQHAVLTDNNVKDRATGNTTTDQTQLKTSCVKHPYPCSNFLSNLKHQRR